MTQHHDPRLHPAHLFHIFRDCLANAPQPGRHGIVARTPEHLPSAFRPGAFGRRHRAEVPTAAGSGQDRLTNAGQFKWDFRDKDHIGAAGDARLQGNETRVPPHKFQHDHPVMGLRRRVQAVERLGGSIDRGVEAESHIGAIDVVVNRLGDPDHGDLFVKELERNVQGPIAAHYDEALQFELFDSRDDLVRHIFHHFLPIPHNFPGKRIPAVGCTQDRAAARQDPVNCVQIQPDHPFRVQAALEPVLDSEDFVAAMLVGRLHDRPNHGIESRRVAPTGENPDSLHPSPR